MKKLFFMLGLLIFTQQYSNACETGFACSIEDLSLKRGQQEEIIIDTINEFFEKELNEEIFFSKLNENTEYNELFIYKSSILTL